MTPYAYPCSSRIEGRFNRAFCSARVDIERSIGVWKRRFPILAKKIRVSINTVPNIIVATAVLHNLANKYNQEVPADIEEDIEEENVEVGGEEAEPYVPGANFALDGAEVRAQLTALFAD